MGDIEITKGKTETFPRRSDLKAQYLIWPLEGGKNELLADAGDSDTKINQSERKCVAHICYQGLTCAASHTERSNCS